MPVFYGVHGLYRHNGNRIDNDKTYFYIRNNTVLFVVHGITQML